MLNFWLKRRQKKESDKKVAEIIQHVIAQKLRRKQQAKRAIWPKP